MSECIHLLEPSTCTICNGRDRQRVRLKETPRSTTRARFVGRCDACDLLIHEDELLGLIDGSWVHLYHFEDGGL